MKIIFAGTPEIAAVHLKALINAGHDICAVYTQPDRPAGRGRKLMPSPVKQLALEHHIPVHQPRSLRKDQAAQVQLNDYRADLMVVVAYGLILPQAVLDMPAHGCFNVHASLLPRWRGAAPIQRAILSGDQKTGITIMQMDAGLDTGDMLYKLPCEIADTETSSSLHDKLCELGPEALLKTVNLLAENKLSPEKQSDDQSTYAEKLTKEQANLRWQQPAVELDRVVRAFNPKPVAFTYYKQQPVRIWRAKCCSEKTTEEPGAITYIDKQSIHVATSDGILQIMEMQLPGSKRLSVRDILNANRLNFVEGGVFTYEK